MVNINTVYQTVLAIANKEQRGYITPQEFNLFANNAQIEIFEQYFYDLNQFGRIPGSQSDYSDPVSMIQDKLNLFVKKETYTGISFSIPQDFYRVATLSVNGFRADHVDRSKQDYYDGPLTSPTDKRPLYYILGNSITTKPENSTNSISFSYIRKPNTPRFGYVVINDKAMYNSLESTDFELHPSEEKNLVNKILMLAGMSIKDIQLAQAASQEEIKSIQQEKI